MWGEEQQAQGCCRLEFGVLCRRRGIEAEEDVAFLVGGSEVLSAGGGGGK